MLLPLLLPGLRGFWFAGSDNVFQWFDMSMSGLYLGAHGTPTVGNATTWPGVLVPYVNFGGTNEYFDKLDTAALSPTGDLTICAWAYWDDFAVNMALVNKWETALGNNRSYTLWTDTSGYLKFAISSDGSVVNSVTATTASVLSPATWYYVQAKFIAGSHVTVRVDDEAWATTATALAAIHDSTRAFHIGEYNELSNSRLDGRIAQAYMCGFGVPEGVLDYIFSEQRSYLGK